MNEGPLEITDVDALKALAHPRRQHILRHLGLHGPATSATLARALGLNTGATSYHLRELARYGFVEEAAKGEHGRERWWQAPKRDLRVPPRARQSEQMRAVVDAMARSEIADDLARFVRLQERQDAHGAWSDGFPHSRGSIRVTPEELREFFEEYIQLVNRYKRADADTPPEARTVLTRFFAFPDEDAPGTGDGAQEEAD